MSQRPWIPHDVEFFSDIDRPDYAVALWAGHRWFGYDLVRWAKPNRVVELGAHYGCSFFAFCQAALADGGDGEFVAIDTWEGDGHTIYDEDVYAVFTGVLERRFATVRTRVQRSTFDDALDTIDDESVDILHIDGLHTYEAVSHDYETWLPKLAPNGIVLFHDIAPSSGLGSARFWIETRDSGPSFSFLHSMGLGILLPKGTEGRQELLDLSDSPWRAYYQHRAGHDLRHRQVIDMTAMIDARDEALAATTRLVDERDQVLRTTESELTETTQLLDASAVELDHTREDLRRHQHELAEATTRNDDLRQELAATAAKQRQSENAAKAATDRLAQVEAELDRTAGELEHLERQLAAVVEDRDAYAGNLELYRKAFRPVRWASRPPRRVLRRIRHGSLPAIGPGNEVTGHGVDRPVVIGDGADDHVAAGTGSAPDLFDPTWYRSRYPDIVRAKADPATHWSSHGWKEGRQPCPLFDAGTYLKLAPDVAAAGIDPLEHWTTSGWREGRDPSALFSTEFYRNRNGDLLPPDTDPLGHYLDRGIGLGLLVSPEHEERVLTISPLTGADDQVLTEVVVDDGDTGPRSVPYSVVGELDADLVTFDLWDTILTRTRPADASKLATARRVRILAGFTTGAGPSTWDLHHRRVEIEAEIAGPSNGEYLLQDVLTRQLTELSGHPDRPAGQPLDVANLANALRHAELEDEMRWTRPIGDTVAVLEKLLGRGAGTRVAVLSDFYLGADDLEELLWHHGIGDDRLEVFSSADLGMSKHAGGAMLNWCRERYGVTADRHVHIGDNPHADVAMQLETGGIAVHLAHGSRRFVGPGQLDETAMRSGIDELRVELDAAAELRSRQSGLRPRPTGRVLHAAWRTALLPVALVAAAVEDAAARGLDRVHYLSREGLFLSRIHAEVAPILWPDETPRAVHLAVSRRSTFGPSLADISPENLLDLWRMYPHQTPRGLLVSLGAEPVEFDAALGRVGLPVDEMIEGIHLDERIAAFLADEEVGARLRAVNTERRLALRTYLEGQTDLDLDQMLVVDVGWRGTVQDNLARLLPDSQLIGWYLALFPFLNPQAANGEKHAVGPDGNRGDEFSYMEPPAAVERPWTPPAPSVVDYRNGPAGVQPVLDEEILDAGSRHAIELYQDAVVEAAPAVARWIVANGASTDVLRPLIAEELASYYTRPEPGIADLWFDSAHDDTFGVLNVTSFGKERPSRSWFSDGLGPGFLRHLEAAADGSLWSAGYRRWRPVEAASAVERALRSNSFRSGR